VRPLDTDPPVRWLPTGKRPATPDHSALGPTTTLTDSVAGSRLSLNWTPAA